MRIAKVVLLACQMGLSQADAQCSDSPGNCQVPRASLMQLKALKQKQQSQTAFGSQLASFQKFTDEMIAKYGQAPDLEIDPTTMTAVDTVHTFIESMYDSLVGYHNQDLNASDRCRGANISGECELVHLDAATKANITGHNATANSAHGNFLQCMGERSTACGEENLFCNRYDSYRQQDATITGNSFIRGDGSKPQYLPDCVVSQNRFNEEHIKANAEGTPEEQDKLAKMEECLRETNTWLNGLKAPLQDDADCESDCLNPRYDGLYPHYQNCDRNHKECDEYHDQCKDNQTRFESDYCHYEMWWDIECGSWKRCSEASEGTCGRADDPSSTCGIIANNVLGRKADNETGERLTCLLDVLFGKWRGSQNFDPRLPPETRGEALANCTSTNYTTDGWDIDCGVDFVPTPDICARTCPPIPHLADGGPHGKFHDAYYTAFGLGGVVEGKHDRQNGINKNVFKTETCELGQSRQYHCNSQGQ